MNWPDFTKRSNAIVILLCLDVFFFLATFVAYSRANLPQELRTICKDAFTGIAGALLLALKLGGPETPTVDDDKGGTVQQITTVTPSKETKTTVTEPPPEKKAAVV